MKDKINSIANDSRKVTDNSIFFCFARNEEQTQQYVNQAIDNGAKVIIHHFDLKPVTGIIYQQVDSVLDEYVRFSHDFYHQASEQLTLVGITGTNGKTTVASLIQSLGSHFTPSGSIGTNGLSYHKVDYKTNLTTPFLHDTLDYLQRMSLAGVELCAIEVSSEGLHQNRAAGLDFDYAIFTNLSHDHLNYHKNLENYLKAKKILFDQLKPDSKAIINIDDAHYQELINDCKASIITYSIDKEADYRAENVLLYPDYTTFELVKGNSRHFIKTNLVAMFNVYNLLSVIAVLDLEGYPLSEIIQLVEAVDSIDGRLNRMEINGIDILVDYAHTPDGFEKIFAYAQAIQKEGKIIVVFGSAGKRDKEKRPVLGEIASRYCDLIILTEEDNRNEKVIDINAEIEAGITNGVQTLSIPDRYEAIEKAVDSATINDLILILGKGAETFLDREHGSEPWISDTKAVELIKKNRNH